jgi:uncharacterized membrane protein YraQ (UPF0718 family)
MWLLIASCAASLIGPLSFEGVRRRRGMMAAVDGFVLVTLIGLILLHILPQSFELAGWWALAAGLVGFGAPMALGRWSPHQRGHRAEVPVLLLAAGGLAVHALLDGVALVAPEIEGAAAAGDMLALAVVLHRLPVGLTVWWIVKPSRGVGWALTLLGVNVAATIAGFLVGGDALAELPLEGLGAFQALVAGSLFHVAFHHPPELREGPPVRFVAGLGGVAGAMLLAAVTVLHGSEEGHGPGPWEAFMAMAFETAPALLFAFAAAGLLSAFLRPASLGWLGRGGVVSQVAKGTAFGLPLPICSCGVLPLYQTLIHSGVPGPAAIAFLVATPELGVDAILVSVPLLGIDLTVARLLAAIGVTALAGLVVGRWVARQDAQRPPPPAPPDALRLRGRVLQGFKYGFGELVDHTFPWVLTGLVIAAMVEPALDQSWFAALPDGVDVVVLALIGMPIYICATGSTPLAAVLVAHGVSPGAAIAFLLTGPATNATTFGVLGRLHGKRGAVLFAATVAVGAVGLGWVVNLVLPSARAMSLQAAASEPPSSLEIGALSALGLLVLASLVRVGPRALLADMLPEEPEGDESQAAPDPDDHDPHGHAQGSSVR